jgi:hypothetical protein
MTTIKELEENNLLFYSREWFIGGAKLVAIHYATEDSSVLCSFRSNNGKGFQYQLNLPDGTKLISK